MEWAIVDRRPGELLAIPADASPFAGSADVEVPSETPGGPLSLRCRFGIWLDARLFEPELRSGTLAPEVVAEALHRFRQIESGTLEASPLAEEVDVDPEHVDWLREVPERARALATTARVRGAWTSRSSSSETAHRLAAALALLAVGLSMWVVLLRREVDRLSTPVFDPPGSEVVLGGSNRAGMVVEVPREASHVLLVLVVDASVETGEGHFEVVDAKGRTVWRSPRVRLIPAGESKLFVPRGRLPDGEYRVRIVSEPGGRPVAEEILEVETRK